MTHRERSKVRPLLAVVAVVSLAACGSATKPAVATPSTASTSAPVEASPKPATTAAATTPASAGSTLEKTPDDPATPLLMPNGSPASGNVGKRASGSTKPSTNP